MTLVVIAGAGVFVGFRLANAKLRQRIDALRQSRAESRQLRESNQRAKALLTEVAGDQAAATRAVQAEIGRLRSEVAELERRAEVNAAQRSVQLAAEAEELANNRDPRIGLVRLEHFKNLGQAAPTAAFQTLVWAALKGDDAVLAQVSTISAPARAKAEALIAGLPEGARSQWTPERLAAMFFTGAFGEVNAAQIATETAKDPMHVALGIRITSGDKDTVVPFQWQLGATGWQVVFDEKLLGAVQKKVANALPPGSGK